MDKDIMKSLVGKVIKIDRGGSESRIGKLMDVYDGYLVLLTEDDGIIYYNTQHIKSVTDNLKEQLASDIEVPEHFEFKKAPIFRDLLDTLRFQWVRINRSGPEKVEGVLTDVNNDFVTLVSQDEVVRLSMFHLRSISYGLKIKKAEEEKSEKSDYQDRKQSGISDSEYRREHQPVVRTNNVSRKVNNNTLSQEDLSEMKASIEKFLRD